MTKSQIILLQTARRQLSLDEADYRLILRNVAGVESSKDLDNVGLENVLAVFEDRGWQYTDHSTTYFRDKVEQRSRRADSRQVHLIEQLVLGTAYRLGGLCLRFSDGRTDQPEKLRPREAHCLIEMLKSARDRKDRPAPSDSAQPSLFSGIAIPAASLVPALSTGPDPYDDEPF